MEDGMGPATRKSVFLALLCHQHRMILPDFAETKCWQTGSDAVFTSVASRHHLKRYTRTKLDKCSDLEDHSIHSGIQAAKLISKVKGLNGIDGMALKPGH